MAIIAPALGQIEAIDQNATEQTAADWFNQGIELYNQDKFAESLQAYDKVTELNPQNADAWNNKGIDLGILGRYDEALYAFQNAVKINSSYAEAWYNMGVIFDFKGDLDHAVGAYNMATDANPDYKKAWYNKDRDQDIIGIGHSSLYNELTGQPSNW